MKGNKYLLLVDSEEFSRELIKSISDSRQSIDVQFMTFEADLVGKKFANLFIDKARKGIKIRVIIDYFSDLMVSDELTFFPLCSLKTFKKIRKEHFETQEMISKMREKGILVKRTNPAGFLKTKFFFRNHKKMIIIDKKVAFSGGFNLSEHNFSWHDFMVKIRGEIVKDIIKDFENTWNEHSEKLDKVNKKDFILNQDYLSKNNSLFKFILSLIKKAQKSIIIESPYLSGKNIIKELIDAAKRGVKIKLIIPALNNVCFYQLLFKYYQKIFFKNNIELYLYNGKADISGKAGYEKFNGMTHAKIMLVDDEIAVFGSSNFNEFNFLSTQEMEIITKNKLFINQIKKRIFEVDIQNSKKTKNISNPDIFNLIVGKVIYNFLYHYFKFQALLNLLISNLKR